MSVDTWPTPEVPMRDARPDEVSRGAAAVRRLAEEHGWEVRVTYARGTVGIVTPIKKPTERSRDRVLGPRIVSSVAVRMRRGERRAFGVWHDRRFSVACKWSAGTWPVSCNVTQLKEWISS